MKTLFNIFIATVCCLIAKVLVNVGIGVEFSNFVMGGFAVGIMYIVEEIQKYKNERK